jgi:putative ABC transport system permease protein
MLFNYFKIALRVIARQKLFSIINVVGLATGLASFLLISSYVKYELSYDQFSNASRIYRVAANLHLASGPSIRALTSPPMAGIIHEDFPEIEKVLRIGQSFRPLSYQDKTFFDIKLYTADSSFFDLFDFSFAAGNKETALSRPNSIVLTRQAAKKYFGDENPLGKQMALSDTITLMVTGILNDSPDHSHLDFDCLYSRTTIIKPYQEPKDSWFNNSFYTYVLLSPSTSYKDLETKFPQMLDKHMGADRKKSIWYDFFLQPVTHIHLHSSLKGEIETNSDMSVIYVFGSIALFILLIASINFMNLSTAKAAKRANEVGIRKTAGALRSQLVSQFLAESLLLSLVSAMLALVIAQLALPAFNNLLNKNLSLNLIESPEIILGFVMVTVIVGLLAGLYPAFFLSKFKPIQVLKGKVVSGRQGVILRQGLVVVQFAISIILIAGTFIIQDQIYFMRTQDLGFNKDQLVVVSIRGSEGTNHHEIIKQRLLQNSNVLAVSASAEPLGRGQSVIATLPEGWDENQITSVTTIMADHDFIGTHQVKLVAGRNFSVNSSSDRDHAFIVNEAAVKLFGWKDNTSAVGKKLNWGLGKEGNVIGVVKDFHYFSLHKQVDPLIIHNDPESYSYLTVRVQPDGNDLQRALATLETEWKSLGMKGAFDYFFLDDDFARQYQADQQLKSFISYFSVLAILIGCLGLYGLAAYSTEQRAKEIGIRRVLGASVPGLVALMSKDFLKLVLIANLFAWPAAWYILNQWLSNFAFHINIGIAVFFLSGSIALLIAWFTVGFESTKAALSNPVESLRNE